MTNPETVAAAKLRAEYGLDEHGNVVDHQTWLANNPDAPQWLRDIVESTEQWTREQAYATMADPAQLAWAADQTGTQVALPALLPRRWMLVCVLALALVGVGVGVAAAVVSRSWSHNATLPTTTTTTTTTQATSTVIFAPPPGTPAAPTPAAPSVIPESDPFTQTDRWFLAQLDSDPDVPKRNPGSDGSAVTTGHMICRALASGQSEQSLRAEMSTTYLTPGQAHAYILDAVMFYCPSALG